MLIWEWVFEGKARKKSCFATNIFHKITQLSKKRKCCSCSLVVFRYVLCVHKQLEIPWILTVSIGTFIHFALLCYLCLSFRHKFIGSYGLTLDAKMKYTQTTYIIDQDWWIYWTIAQVTQLGMLGVKNSNKFSIWFEMQMYIYLYNPVLIMEKILLSSNLSELFFNYDKLNDTKLKQVYTGEKLGLLSW